MLIYKLKRLLDSPTLCFRVGYSDQTLSFAIPAVGSSFPAICLIEGVCSRPTEGDFELLHMQPILRSQLRPAWSAILTFIQQCFRSLAFSGRLSRFAGTSLFGGLLHMFGGSAF